MFNRPKESSIRVDKAYSVSLLNRYMAFIEVKTYNCYGSVAENQKPISEKSFYKVQWQNIKADAKGLFKKPSWYIPRVAASLAAFAYIFIGHHEQAFNFAFAGALAYDTAGQTSHSGEPATISFNLTVANVANRFVSVGMYGLNGGLTSTVGGAATTNVHADVGALNSAYYIGPATGTVAVVGSNGNIKTMGAIVLNGVTQSSPIGASASNSAGASPKTMALTTTTDGSMRIDIMGTGKDNSTVPTGTVDVGTIRFNPDTPQNQFHERVFGVTNPVVTAGAANVVWTTDGFTRAYSAYEVKPFVAATSPNLTMMGVG